MKVHCCWFDQECRSLGVPAFTYFHFKRFTIRINPIYDRSSLGAAFDGSSPWSWHVVQIIRRS